MEIFLYGIAASLIIGSYLLIQRLRDRRSRAMLDEAVASGMNEPASLHPVIDPVKCLGCGSCAKACPENDVLGIIQGKAHLVNPAHCIGHGACRKACPLDAIELVFGTEKRGVDIPFVNADFQTNIDGIFIAGELGGMGLIRNAATQGVQAMQSICKRQRGEHDLDVVIVGAGPAGIAASLMAMSNKLDFVTLEQDTLGGTVSHYPRGKIVMTAPVKLPIIGKMHFKETTKEALMEFWQDILDRTGLVIKENERVDEIAIEADGFRVNTAKGSYSTRSILLAIGRRGTPRKLGVPGEEQSKVVYRLIDAEQYRGQHVLVVGGGDSALEAAVSISEVANTTVTLSYRSEAFSRAKQKNRDRVSAAEQAGRLRVLMRSNVMQVNQGDVIIDTADGRLQLDNDAIIVCAGGILPTPFLKSMGIEVETKFGTA